MANATEGDSNREQIEYWNEQAGPKWVQNEALLDAQLEPYGMAALDRANLADGQRVLDVGCGCGDTTLEIARRVAPKGTAVGLDVSAPMLDRAAERARHEGLDNAVFELADAATFAPADHVPFDAVASRFGVMFFDEPVAAFTNLHGLLGAGGRLSFVCWQGVEKNPWLFLPVLAAAEIVEVKRPEDPYAPGPLAFADIDRTTGILRSAGFHDVAYEPFEIEVAVAGGQPLEQSAEFLLTLGPLARALNENPEVDRARVLEAVKNAVEPYAENGTVRMPSAAWLVSANRG